MSELIVSPNGSFSLRPQLLASVSAAVLTVSVCVTSTAVAEDNAEKPTVWIELGGQLDRMTGEPQAFAPAFAEHIPSTSLSLSSVEKPPRYSFGGEGSITIEPAGNNWDLSVAVQFGRLNSSRNSHHQTPNARVPVLITSPKYDKKYYYPAGHVKFADAQAKQGNSHVIIDFQAGRDAGLGMFNKQISSTLSLGVRFAQLSSSSTVNIRAETDLQYPTMPIHSFAALAAWNNAAFSFHDYAGVARDHRNFQGVGPEAAWKATVPVEGGSEHNGFAIEGGANIAVLFGRQKASVQHQTATQTYFKQHWYRGFASGDGRFGTAAIQKHGNAASRNGSRFAFVPNVGGFAAVSANYANAKVSLGYRADFFVGAMDGGIDSRKTENTGFYGPFATISVGFGG